MEGALWKLMPSNIGSESEQQIFENEICKNWVLKLLSDF